MLTFRQLDDLPDTVVDYIAAAEQEIINDMARRIAKVGAVTDTAQWQLARLEAMGAERDYILHHLNRALNMSEQQLIRLFDEAATRTLAVDDTIYRAAGYNPLPLADNTYMQYLIQAGLKKTLSEYRNLTLTTAATATQQFENALDLAYHRVVSGGFSYQQAIREGVRSLTSKGLATIQYPSGRVDHLDVAFRRATLTGVNQTAAEVQLRRMDELDIDLVETTAHHGARTALGPGPENHAWWQGRWFSRSHKPSKYPDFYEQTGYGTGPGLCGWNCRHSFFPVIEGLSDRAYSIKQLRDLNSRTVSYNGEDVSLYDATQQQRYIERQIRRWKREASAMDAAGLDSSAAKSKVREWQATQRDFISQTGLTRDYFRERAGKQNLEIAPKRGIISLDAKGRTTFAKMDYADLAKNDIRASNLAVRQWYDGHVKDIPNQIDQSQTLEAQAQQAHALRNLYREQARNLMADQTERKRLDSSDPNQSFEDFIAGKMKEKGLTRQEVLEYMLGSAARTNKSVNRKLGLEE